MNGEFIKLHTLLNKQSDSEAQENRVLFMNRQFTLKPTNAIKHLQQSMLGWIFCSWVCICPRILMKVTVSSNVWQMLNSAPVVFQANWVGEIIIAKIVWRKLMTIQYHGVKLTRSCGFFILLQIVHSVLKKTQASPNVAKNTITNLRFLSFAKLSMPLSILKFSKQIPCYSLFWKTIITKFGNYQIQNIFKFHNQPHQIFVSQAIDTI